ncbi:hypothetical protein PUR49_07985 [Streptomyces sp. BE147]|nr:hypothetical protein [Streptomyces sp. BE147]
MASDGTPHNGDCSQHSVLVDGSDTEYLAGWRSVMAMPLTDE